MGAEVDATFGLMHAFPTVGTAGRGFSAACQQKQLEVSLLEHNTSNSWREERRWWGNKRGKEPKILTMNPVEHHPKVTRERSFTPLSGREMV